MLRTLHTPVQHTHRKVPITAREKIEQALQHMVDQGIITPVTEPTEWVSSLTYPRKSDGTIRPCLDPRDLNKAIGEHYNGLDFYFTTEPVYVFALFFLHV